MTTMEEWVPPASISLSTNDIDHVHAGLTNRAHREAALAFLDTVTDPGLLYVIACKVAFDRSDRPVWSTTVPATSSLRHYIRNRV